jgi:hypothetical protein
MKFKNTLEVLHANTEEVKLLMARLEKSNELSTIELDLILAKLRNIYDLVLDMQNSLSVKGSTSTESPLDTVNTDDSMPMEIIEKGPEQTIDERKIASKEQIEKDIRKNEPVEEKKTSSEAFVSDRFKVSKPSLNEELALKAKSKEASLHIKNKPAQNLSGALGLNEKFELINELFQGNKEKFELTMQELNAAGSFVDAYNYLNTTFNWDMDNPYVQRILELIRRKLIVKRDEQ